VIEGEATSDLRSIKITLPAALGALAVTSAQPRAAGAVTLSAKTVSHGSVLDDLHQSGAMKALFPMPRSRGLQAILVNTAGGITGGDRFSLHASAGESATLGLTTQAAERAYRAQPDETATVRNHLHAKQGARIAWLPQETILFEGCALHRQMRVDLDDGAELLLVEPLAFGRVAMGETLRQVRFRDRIEIRRRGVPLFLDAMTIHGDLTGHLAAPHVAGQAGAMALIVYVGAGAEGLLKPLRALMPATGGASLIGADMLVARLLAADAFALRETLVPALERLSHDDLPRSWMT
jgi:urease accessory protein